MASISPRIALIHATPLAVAPVGAAFTRLWPEARTTNLLDDSLSADLATDGALTAVMRQRFATLADYVVGCGADAILFTCSAFGPAIEAVAAAHADKPVLKPNEAMFRDAIALGGTIGLVATFGPSVPSMAQEFEEMARTDGAQVELVTACADGAMAALGRGEQGLHDRMVIEAARRLDGCRAIMLAQFSMASAQPLVADAVGVPVLTSPDSAVRALQSRMGG
ncbi:MAG: arylsulfatase [Hyphomicrobiaceae bacterium]|nr:arylsulfatase [Hyphomicrobiaceae bacterium]